jgi:hypothetical protein
MTIYEYKLCILQIKYVHFEFMSNPRFILLVYSYRKISVS